LVSGKAMICTKLKERRPLYDANLILGERAASSDPRLFDGSHDLSPFFKLFVLPHRFWLLGHIFLQTATTRQSPSIYNQSCSCWLFVIFHLGVSELRTSELHFMLAVSLPPDHTESKLMYPEAYGISSFKYRGSIEAVNNVMCSCHSSAYLFQVYVVAASYLSIREIPVESSWSFSVGKCRPSMHASI